MVRCPEHNFLVDRTLNENGGMVTIERDDAARAEADREAELLRSMYGENPW